MVDWDQRSLALTGTATLLLVAGLAITLTSGPQGLDYLLYAAGVVLGIIAALDVLRDAEKIEAEEPS